MLGILSALIRKTISIRESTPGRDFVSGKLQASRNSRVHETREKKTSIRQRLSALLRRLGVGLAVLALSLALGIPFSGATPARGTTEGPAVFLAAEEPERMDTNPFQPKIPEEYRFRYYRDNFAFRVPVVLNLSDA